MEWEGRNTVTMCDIDVCCGTLITHTLDEMHTHTHTACVPLHTSVLNISIFFSSTHTHDDSEHPFTLFATHTVRILVCCLWICVFVWSVFASHTQQASCYQVMWRRLIKSFQSSHTVKLLQLNFVFLTLTLTHSFKWSLTQYSAINVSTTFISFRQQIC